MRNQRTIIMTIIGIVVLIGVTAFVFKDRIVREFFQPTASNTQTGINRESASELTVLADNLDIPWGLAFLPDGGLLVTERTGTLRHIDQGRTYDVRGVEHVGEGGLLGLALHPDFEDNSYLYLYMTTKDGDGLKNRVVRYVYADDTLRDGKTILDDIPGAQYHDGGRLEFGQDGYLYVATGDAGFPTAAQDINSLAGKILRVTDDGRIPRDNPFNNAVYSYGHRNPQGIAWDDQGRLWSTEHGPSGLQSGYDELNLIRRGGNYGWPVVKGNERREDMIQPVAHSGPRETWAPASLAYHEGSLYFGGLRGVSLYEAVIQSENDVVLRAHFRGDFGRVRDVAVGPKGEFLYITTSNTDGRGEPRDGDDKVLQLNASLFTGNQ